MLEKRLRKTFGMQDGDCNKTHSDIDLLNSNQFKPKTTLSCNFKILNCTNPIIYKINTIYFMTLAFS